MSVRALFVIIAGVLFAVFMASFKTKKKPKLSDEVIATLKSVETITNYGALNVHNMEVFYDYNLDNLTPIGVHDTQTLMQKVFDEVVPDMHVEYTAPEFGCSAFTLQKEDGTFLMGRNYDFYRNTATMMVLCHPKGGYASIAHAALDNLNCNNPFGTRYENLACLATPFVCLDGINEKGVGIAVLTVDSEPVCHDTGKPVLATPMLIRLVLDKAESTKAAIELLKKYDMFASSGKDYHFYICDQSGDACIVEFDCDSENREMVVTPARTATNFYMMYKDEVKPNQKNGVYGHGRERYDAIEEVLDAHGGKGDKDVAWEAIKAAAQEPKEGELTSNTQWSVVYDFSTLTYEFVYRRLWDDVLFSDRLQKGVFRTPAPTSK